MSQKLPSSESSEIAELFREWAELEVKGDLASWIEFVAEDAVLQPAGEPEVRGKEAIRKYMASFFDLPISVMEPGEFTVVVSDSGDLAFHAGNLRMVLDNPEGRAEYDMKSAVVWQKIDGNWKVKANSWSSNNP